MSGSTGKIVGAIAGAALAYFTGGLSVVALGATLGSMVGGLLDKGPNTQGPRLDDLKVTVSTYGIGIPILYGTERMGGNVIWSTDKIELATTQGSGGGKGGGATNTTYAYYVHMTIALCQTPRDGSTVGLVQIFQDGKLIWDAHSGIPVASALASSANPYSSFQLWQGNETQLPDPIEESWLGVGNVPAYRGIVRIRMIAIECPSGRIPQFSFVLSTGATVGIEKKPFVNFPRGTAGVVQSDGVWHFNVVNNGAGASQTLETFYGTSTGAAALVRNTAMQIDSVEGNPSPVTGSPVPMIARGLETISSGIRNRVEVINLQDGTRSTIVDRTVGTLDSTLGISNPLSAAFDQVTKQYAFLGGAYSTGPINFILQAWIAGAISAPLPAQNAKIAYYNGLVYAVYYGSGQYSLAVIDGTGAIINTIAGPGPFGITSSTGAMIQADASGVYVWIQTGVSGGTAAIYKIDPVASTWTLLCSDANPVEGAKDVGHPSTFYCTSTSAIVGPADSSGTAYYDLIRFNSVTLAPYKVSSIITDQCQRAGVQAFDVSGIPNTDTVTGYKLGTPASARANIDPLLVAFGIFIVDENGSIFFKKYSSITPVAAITFNELGQAENGGEPGDPMPLSRKQEIDLARSVTASYIDPIFDYQTASQKAVRMITGSTADQSVSLPIAMSAAQAQAAAQMVLYASWRAQNTRTVSLSRKYAFMSPGDGAMYEYPQGTSRLWRVMSQMDDGVTIQQTLEPGDASVYSQVAIGAAGYVSQAVPPLPSPTRGQILDMPIVRDADNNASLYVALDSYAGIAADAQLYVGDDDSTLVSRGIVSASAPIGFAETTMGAAVSTGVDETNLLTANLGDDTPASCTRDVLIAGGGEYWAYGAPGRWEIGSSAVVSTLGGGRFVLSRHLRGQFGTEQFTGTHVAGDTFVLLRIAGLLRPSFAVGDIGLTKSYRAVTRGRALDSIASQTYANTGQGLMPLNPINLRRSTDASNNVTYTWDPRSRLSFNNLTGTAQMGETSEAYSIDFYSSGAFTTRVGTLTSTTASLTLTAAQATAWGLTPGAANFMNVFQVSGQVGNGHALQATL